MTIDHIRVTCETCEITSNVTPAQVPRWDATHKGHKQRVHVYVMYNCHHCSAVNVIDIVKWRSRKNRSLTGRMYCDRSCSAKDRRERSLAYGTEQA